MNIYHRVTKDGNGLSVAIDRWGLTAAEMTPIRGMIEDAKGDFLVVKGSWTWRSVRNRERCYAGDNGKGRMASRLVAAAISLLGYWGGQESFVNAEEDFEPVD